MAVADRLLAINRPLTVVTHSLSAAAALTPRPDTDVLMLGGRVRSASMATIGSSAAAMLSDLTIDMAVLSSSGISLERGLSTSGPETAELKRVAMDAARQRLFVDDHTEYGIISFCRYADVQEFNAVITDSGLPTTVAARYKPQGHDSFVLEPNLRHHGGACRKHCDPASRQRHRSRQVLVSGEGSEQR